MNDANKVSGPMREQPPHGTSHQIVNASLIQRAPHKPEEMKMLARAFKTSVDSARRPHVLKASLRGAPGQVVAVGVDLLPENNSSGRRARDANEIEPTLFLKSSTADLLPEIGSNSTKSKLKKNDVSAHSVSTSEAKLETTATASRGDGNSVAPALRKVNVVQQPSATSAPTLWRGTTSDTLKSTLVNLLKVLKNEPTLGAASASALRENAGARSTFLPKPLQSLNHLFSFVSVSALVAMSERAVDQLTEIYQAIRIKAPDVNSTQRAEPANRLTAGHQYESSPSKFASKNMTAAQGSERAYKSTDINGPLNSAAVKLISSAKRLMRKTLASVAPLTPEASQALAASERAAAAIQSQKLEGPSADQPRRIDAPRGDTNAVTATQSAHNVSSGAGELMSAVAKWSDDAWKISANVVTQAGQSIAVLVSNTASGFSVHIVSGCAAAQELVGVAARRLVASLEAKLRRPVRLILAVRDDQRKRGREQR